MMASDGLDQLIRQVPAWASHALTSTWSVPSSSLSASASRTPDFDQRQKLPIIVTEIQPDDHLADIMEQCGC
jgi:hypothetical protein